MQKRKPGQPHRGWKSAARGAMIHDRKSNDLTINAMVVEAVVDDPYGCGGEKLRVVRSIRDDILGHLHARKEIDDARFEAGRLYERYIERSQIGSVKAMDPTKEPVDGGGFFFEPISDTQKAAVQQLSKAAQVLGRKGEALVRQILVERRKFKEVALTLAERDVAFTRRQFFECLEELAVLWCLAGRR